MKIAVLGTGAVGNSIATGLARSGHEVRMGSRTARNEKAVAWARAAGALASEGSFADAADFAELIFNCTNGAAALEALNAAGADRMIGKVLVDVSNPLDFSKGMPPGLFTGPFDSLAEQIQRAFPQSRVVKTLNTVNASVMVDPRRVGGGEHDLPIAGNDAEAKSSVRGILSGWGWKNVIDLGDITAARAMEAYVLYWLRLYGALGTTDFNIHVVR